MASKNTKDRNEGKSEQEAILQSRTVSDLSYLTAEHQKHALREALTKKFGLVHGYHDRPQEDVEVVYFVKQGDGKFRGYLLATLTESVTEYHKKEFSKNKVKVVIDVQTRPLTRSEFGTIEGMIVNPDEAHDFDNFKNDVFVMEEVQN